MIFRTNLKTNYSRLTYTLKTNNVIIKLKHQHHMFLLGAVGKKYYRDALKWQRHWLYFFNKCQNKEQKLRTIQKLMSCKN